MTHRQQRYRTSRLATAAALLVSTVVVGAVAAQPMAATADETAPSGTGTSDTSGSSGTPLPIDGYDLQTTGVPRVEDYDCNWGDRVRCLWLVVPETRDGGAADPERLVRLPVFIISALVPSNRRPDPVLWVDYSAGDGFINGHTLEFNAAADEINTDRDMITINLRGSGFAEPSLTCPELTELNRRAFSTDIDETTPEGRAMRLDAIEECHARLVAEGINLSAFGADDAAQDLEDLRVALGLEQWNLVAGEYGSKLAQILARDHPDGLRSVVVHSTPIPLQADWFADLAGNGAGGWEALVASCAADADCSAAYPDLDGGLAAHVADLTADPRHHEAVIDDGGATEPLLVTASRLLSWVRFYTRTGDVAVPLYIDGPPGSHQSGPYRTFDPDVPDTLNYLANDARFTSAWGLWEPMPSFSSTDLGTYSFGAHLSSVCRDEAPFTDPAALSAAGDVPLFGAFLGHHADLDACDVWAVEPAPPEANQPVHSDVPFLVLAGDLDTVSSPAWADAFADGLTAAQIVHFPGIGTQPTGGETTAKRCARDIRDAFLDDPTAPVDDSCVVPTHLRFVLP